MEIKNIIFDFGGVLVDWNPRYLYQKYFYDQDDMEFFLKYICNDQWNLEQDRGRSFADGVKILQDKYPEYHSEIAMYDSQWDKMLKVDIPETVEILHQLKKHYNVYGLTNWSAEKIQTAYKKFDFFKEFDGILVSGEEKLVKPDPKIYELLIERYNLKADESIFIDDNISNIEAARKVGFIGINFTDPLKLKEELMQLNVL